MKRIIVIALAIVLVISAVACTDTTVTVENESVGDTSMFVIVESSYSWTVIYHRQTKVMYLIAHGKFGSAGGVARGGATIMLDADGMPLLWSGE